jgi:hypothetical protein
MMKRTISPTPAQQMDSHRPARCYPRVVREVDGHQRKIGVLVLVLAAVLVPGLLTAGCYYPASTFTPPMPGDGTDAGADSDGGNTGPDAAVCFGTAFRVCLLAAPTLPLSISQPKPIDTSDLSMCVATAPTGSFGCVLAGTTITVEATLRATGSRPLILIASESITIKGSGVIDVGSHRGATPELGAGADPSQDCPPGQPPKFHGGGGAGGSFLGLGGTGGPSVSAAGGTPGPPVTEPNQLRGGCAGQGTPGPTTPTPVQGGHGGGAVLLIAGQLISVDGAINAAGGGGEGGPPDAGGGGGGSGGMIVLDAPTITGNGLILASGGGGGGGSSTDATATHSGKPGADPSGVSAAAGGTGGPNGGGRGGNGSSAGTAKGDNGLNGVSDANGAGRGGGGGGGAGIVKAPVALGSLQVSPAPRP